MIVIAGTVRVRPDSRSEALHVARQMALASRREPGCVTYRFSVDIDDPDLICLFEEWESAEALAAHFQTPHMAAFQQQIPQFVAAPPEIRRYEC